MDLDKAREEITLKDKIEQHSEEYKLLMVFNAIVQNRINPLAPKSYLTVEDIIKELRINLYNTAKIDVNIALLKLQRYNLLHYAINDQKEIIGYCI